MTAEVEPRLIDRDYGRWAGHTKADVVSRWGSLDDAPGVEQTEQVYRRVREVLDEQLAQARKGPVVLVAHDATNRLLLGMINTGLGEPDTIAQRTACWNLLRYTDGAWAVVHVDQKPAMG